jgi:plasmid stability protein
MIANRAHSAIMRCVRQLIARIDDDLHRRLKARAAAEGRSVNALVTDALTAAVAGSDERAHVRARAGAIGLLVLPLPEAPPPSRRQAIAATRGSGTAVSDALEAERARR